MTMDTKPVCHIILGLDAEKELKKHLLNSETALRIFNATTPSYHFIGGASDITLKRFEVFGECVRSDHQNQICGPIFISDLFERIDEAKYEKTIPLFEMILRCGREIYICVPMRRDLSMALQSMRHLEEFDYIVEVIDTDKREGEEI